MKSGILCASFLICSTLYARLEAPVPVDLYMESDNVPWAFISTCKVLVSEIFASIGVSVTWHAGLPPGDQDADGPPAFTIRWLRRAPASVSDAALASAHPFHSGGADVLVYEDRLQDYLKHHPDIQTVAPAYILAHELAHVMQGIDRHSDSGILKAVWSPSDRYQIIFHKLAFTPADVELIHCGLEGRMSHQRAN